MLDEWLNECLAQALPKDSPLSKHALPWPHFWILESLRCKHFS